jgi:hypothetical protein
MCIFQYQSCSNIACLTCLTRGVCCNCVARWLAVCSCVTFELLDEQSQPSKQQHQQQQQQQPIVRIMIDHEPLQTALLPVTAEGDVLLSGIAIMPSKSLLLWTLYSTVRRTTIERVQATVLLLIAGL